MIARALGPTAVTLALAACGPRGDGEATAGSGATTGIATSEVATSEVATSASTTSDATTSDAATASGEGPGSGEVMPPSCLPAELRGPWLATVAGLNLHAGVDDGVFMIERPGAALLEPDAVHALHGAIDWFPLFAIPGVITTGYGLCLAPPAGSPHRCVRIGLSTHTTAVEALAVDLAALLDDADEGCFGLRVELIGLTEPRCEADDPECLPLPLCDECTLDPEAPRIPALGPHEGACEHDGECWLNGCSSHCDAWTVPGFIGPCSADAGECRHCGCVDGLCQWFTQGEDEPPSCW